MRQYLTFSESSKGYRELLPFSTCLCGNLGFSPWSHPQSLISLSEFHTYSFWPKKTHSGKCGIRPKQKVHRAHTGLHQDGAGSLLQWGLLMWVTTIRILLMSLLLVDIRTVPAQYLQRIWSHNLCSQFSIGFSEALPGFKCRFQLQSVGLKHVAPLCSHINFTISYKFLQHSKGWSLIQKSEMEKILEAWLRLCSPASPPPTYMVLSLWVDLRDACPEFSLQTFIFSL